MHRAIFPIILSPTLEQREPTLSVHDDPVCSQTDADSNKISLLLSPLIFLCLKNT